MLIFYTIYSPLSSIYIQYIVFLLFGKIDLKLAPNRRSEKQLLVPPPLDKRVPRVLKLGEKKKGAGL